MLTKVLLVGVCYLLGSLIFSVIIGKLICKVDIRNYGSGNAGATNTLRVIGKGPALLVFLLDVAKGALCVLLAKWLFPDDAWVAVLCGISVIVGHNWPIWFRFRGGKGIASTVGMLLTLAPAAALISGAVAIAIIVLTRYVSLGSLLFTGVFPLAVMLLGYPDSALAWGSLVILALALMRHRTNIVKLVKGQENKLGVRSGTK